MTMIQLTQVNGQCGKFFSIFSLLLLQLSMPGYGRQWSFKEVVSACGGAVFFWILRGSLLLVGQLISVFC